MELSAFGRRLTSDSGTRSLMDDLGDIASAGGGIMNLGGGNPSLIPAAEAVFRRRMRAFLERDRAFERAIGAYGGPDGDRGFARALAGFLQDELGWAVTERNIALTNGSQSAFVALFNLLAGPMSDGRPARRILLPLAPEYIGYADIGFAPGVLTACRSTIRELGDQLFKYGVDFDALEAVDG
ncbi:MAG: valine--pyruvate transaminase, partial [Acidobacteria bacterium]|nr:valine--pyruvate transaminase [Acidobacteriota bacterium]